LIEIKPTPHDYENKDYGALSALRCLILKLYEPQKWKKLIRLESHNAIRVDLPVWESNRQAVEVILETWKLNDLFTEEEIYTVTYFSLVSNVSSFFNYYIVQLLICFSQVCGIFEVNAFEMGDFSSYGGIFPTPSMLAHDCVPNACQNENMDDNTLEIHAMMDIPAGSVITLCYDASLKVRKNGKNIISRLHVVNMDDLCV